MKVSSCWLAQLAGPVFMGLCSASSPHGWQCGRTKANTTHLPRRGWDSVRYYQDWHRIVSDPSRKQFTVSFTLVLKVLGLETDRCYHLLWLIRHLVRLKLDAAMLGVCWDHQNPLTNATFASYYRIQDINVSSWMGNTVPVVLSRSTREFLTFMSPSWRRKLQTCERTDPKMTAKPWALANPIPPLIQLAN